MKNLSLEDLLYREWLVTNGLGGFASCTISGAPTRKYHSLLTSALPAPFGRTIMLNYIADAIILPNKEEVPLTALCVEHQDCISEIPITDFHLVDGCPLWHYEIDDIILEKHLRMVHMQNTTHITYHLVSSKSMVYLKWRPYFHFRTNEQPVNHPIPGENYAMTEHEFEYTLECLPFPKLRIYNDRHAEYINVPHVFEKVFYNIEAKRGYESLGSLTSPGYFLTPIHPSEKVTFIASTENWQNIHALPATEASIAERLRKRSILKASENLGASSSAAAKLVLAADQFIITPISRFDDVIRLQASGEQVRSIIAGYPWFTDWGRDTMISLEGLTMATGRIKEAHAILRTFAFYIQNGLIPNMFPDGSQKGIYNTADATLWFFHAVDRYISLSGDDNILELLLPKFNEIIASHIKGTDFGIGVDSDALLKQGQEGYQLTWMDAKVGDWVVTPRRGKAVEINALWYNALKLMEKWSGKPSALANQCYDSFNKRFWNEQRGYLYDVVDGESGDDSALRPNQLFAISLSHPVLAQDKWKPVLDIVYNDLFTPFGIRTLSPSHPEFKAHYDGNLLSRDAAYHQGSVWPWLLGPFIDVWLKVYPDNLKTAQSFLIPLLTHIDDQCVGTICEIFDATPPYYPRGCFAQAWSVAEILRCLIKTKFVETRS